LPVYDQPPIPEPGYIWTPGYWAWDDDSGYYWVPGTWVLPPEPALLWTPAGEKANKQQISSDNINVPIARMQHSCNWPQPQWSKK
jgi:hypothetical protein